MFEFKNYHPMQEMIHSFIYLILLWFILIADEIIVIIFREIAYLNPIKYNPYLLKKIKLLIVPHLPLIYIPMKWYWICQHIIARLTKIDTINRQNCNTSILRQVSLWQQNSLILYNCYPLDTKVYNKILRIVNIVFLWRIVIPFDRSIVSETFNKYYTHEAVLSQCSLIWNE